MTHGVAFAAFVLVAGAMPALAQTHTQTHDRAHSHGPGHVRPDSAQHAAMHALLHGSWTGTLVSAQGVSSVLDLSIAHDSLHTVALKMSADSRSSAAGASNFVIEESRLSWTQELSGSACKATATVTGPASRGRITMEGKMVCGNDASTFSLRKQTE